jgi:O-antigen/teichoic acid export membrane protein
VDARRRHEADPGVAMVAPDAVLVLMGDQWLAAVPLIRILTCAGIFRASASGAQLLFIAIGKPRLAATLAVVRAVLLIPLVVIGTFWADAAGAAWAILATSGVMCAVNLSLVVRVLQLRAGSLLHVTYRPMLATVVMVAGVWGIDSVLPPRSDFLSASFCLIAAALVGVAVYSASLLALWSLAGRPHGAEWSALRFLKLPIASEVAS